MIVDPNCPECHVTDVIVLGDPAGPHDEVACVRCGELDRHVYAHLTP